MTETHRHFTAEQKVAIVRRRLLEQVPVPDLCDEYGIQPSVFYRWQQQLFENGAAAFARPSKDEDDTAGQKIKALEEKLLRKNDRHGMPRSLRADGGICQGKAPELAKELGAA